MKASQLRDLTRRYASGGIARDAYLAERKRLIDAVTSGDEALKYRELDPPNLANTSGKSSRTRATIAGASLLLVLLIAFAAHFLGNDETQPVENASVVMEESSEVVLLLEGFNETDDWTDQALTALEQQWQGFPDAERKEARSSLPYRRLQREVETRIKEHEALVAAGGEPDALMRAARLRMFSERLGFEQ